ncbi:MAG: single-stranded-DNA-specific exonuclease RecJ [Nitrospinaceae bacterium]|nr:MAG: single-stranded-DNA-specific exonuclease RecJ [Nitrospinaceae bacterium]
MISLLHKTWHLQTPEQDLVKALAKDLKIPEVLAALLVNRKVTTLNEARSFVDANLSQLHDPFLMTGMQKAVDRVVKAIEAHEKITVFCDYDVDGVSSAAFLIHFFRDLNVTVDYYLPERMAEGYGLNEEAVRKIRAGGSALMITADCGITGNLEVKTANEIGLDVIVTDHHQVGADGLPDSVAVLNPHQPDCKYPFRFLSGVGIVFKLATAVRSALHHQSGWEKTRLPNLKKHLDLFTLGTIADVAPLTGENHILCSHGLEVMATSLKPGMVALKSVAGADETINARTVGFALGPRLNAAGRLGKADAGLHLLTSTKLEEAMAMAKDIDDINTERKKIQQWTLEEAEYLIDREIDLDNDRVIVLASDNFHAGVIGIVASRIVEKYFRPTVLIALADGAGKGSGRSIPKFNLFKAFSDCSEHFIQFGGHAYAAGLHIEENHIEPFRQAINAVGHRFLKKDDLIPELRIDACLNLDAIDRNLLRGIQRLEPFGAENPMPVFMARGVRIQNLRTMGKEENHIRFRAVQDKGKIDVIGFGMAEAAASIDTVTDSVDIAYEIHLNTWNGQNKVELQLKDIRHSGSDD